MKLESQLNGRNERLHENGKLHIFPAWQSFFIPAQQLFHILSVVYFGVPFLEQARIR